MPVRVMPRTRVPEPPASIPKPQIIKRDGDPSVYQFGVGKDEAGIVVRNFVVRYFPEIDEKIKDVAGNTIVRAQSDTFCREVTCEGEVTGNTGVMLFTLGAALFFANEVQEFRPIVGTLLLDEATTTETKTGWRSVSIKASSVPFV